MSAKKRSRPRPKTFTLSGIRDPRRRREAFETTLRAFAGIDRWERLLEEAVWRGPLFDPEHTRVTVAPLSGRKGECRAVSVVVMGPRVIRFGSALVPAMTIGPVGTDDRCRKRGYGSAAMKDAARYMKETGYLAAYLGGIPDYYHRFGYYPFTAGGRVKFGRKDAKRESSPGRLRRMKRADISAVAGIYEGATSARTCAAARDRKVWDWLLECGRRTWIFPEPRVIVDGGKAGRGRPCGYLTMNAGDRFGVREIVVKHDEASCRAALGAICREARRREAGEIELPLPWDDHLAVFLRQHVGGEFRIRSHATGGALMKIVDFPELMRRLEPAFTERWLASRTALQGGRFTLESEIGAAGFTLSRGGVKVGGPARGGSRVRIPERWLSGLLTGYHPVRSIAPRRGAAIPPALVPTLEILFPAGWPFTYQGDSY